MSMSDNYLAYSKQYRMVRFMINIVFVGIGQCGNRFANCFYEHAKDASYLADNFSSITAVAVNTCYKDMSTLSNIPIRNKIDIRLDGNLEGTGRNPQIGRESMEENLDDVYTGIMAACDRAGMDRVDLCFLWAGLGGGTGTGGLQVLAEHLVKKGHNIAIGVTMPHKLEGVDVHRNAYNAMVELQKWFMQEGIHDIPCLIIDNNKISDMTLERSNEIIANNICRMNTALSFELAGSNFDNSDFLNVLKRDGAMAFIEASVDASILTSGKSDVLLNAVREEISKAPYTNCDAFDAFCSAIIAVAPRSFLDRENSTNRKILKDNIEVIQSQLTATETKYSAVYVYPSEIDNENVFVYMLLTGLANPDKELDEMDKKVNELIMRKKELMKKNRCSIMKRVKIVDDDDDDMEVSLNFDKYTFKD